MKEDHDFPYVPAQDRYPREPEDHDVADVSGPWDENAANGKGNAQGGADPAQQEVTRQSVVPPYAPPGPVRRQTIDPIPDYGPGMVPPAPPQPVPADQPKRGNGWKTAFIICLVVILLAATGTVMYFVGRNKPVTVEETEGALQPVTGSSLTEAAPVTEATLPTAAETAATTAAPTETTTAPVIATTAFAATTAAPETGWEDAPSDQLYHPGSSYYVSNYHAYVFCIDVEVQDYVKMRKGPSKLKFDTVGVIIPNYNCVTVETVSVNGWSLCLYNGTEGWIRSDFLFVSVDDILAILPDGVTVPEGIYEIRIDSAADGNLVNMRSQPKTDAALVVQLPAGEYVSVAAGATVTGGRVYATFHPTVGSKYPNDSYSGYLLLQYLRYVDGGLGDKPVLYLYPEKATDIDVSLRLAQNVHFTCTYPAYRNGWQVTAKPDGTLTDRTTGKEYAYLYWELGGSARYDFSSGFVVRGSDTAAFLESKLTEIGLSARERNEFIVYWLPRMQDNPYNLISFQSEAYTSLVELNISPSPDSLLRVFMAYRPLEEPVEVPPQRFETFRRTGFTAVEWGGVECLY